MPQALLPYFPEECTLINQHLGVQMRDKVVYYFNGQMPIFQHPEGDNNSFRLITSQLVVNGNSICEFSDHLNRDKIAAYIFLMRFLYAPGRCERVHPGHDEGKIRAIQDAQIQRIPC